MKNFADHFWGEKNNGFDVLYHNMKYGQLSSKEFADFLRESCMVEETYSKLMSKLAKLANNCGSQGSFGPFWQILKTLAEKLASLHLQLVHTWSDLIKDVHRYTEEQHKRHKCIKDSESSTLEVVQSIQQTTIALQKAKETYHARCLEFEKLKRENGTPKDIEKAETKAKKATDEYRYYVDKYGNIRNDFEKKFTESCKIFQEVEETHLSKMHDFVETYTKAWDSGHALIGQVHEELRSSSNELTVEQLIDTFVKKKATGTEKPGPIEFEEADLSSLPPPVASPSPEENKKDASTAEKPKKEGFLGKGKKDKKDKKKKKKKDKKDNNEANETENDEQHSPRVDEDGFSVRPSNPLNNDVNSWYSSSDSDSDDDSRRKIKVEIKPISPNGTTPTGNEEDIKKFMEGLRLSPSAMRKKQSESNMKRSISVSETMNSNNKPSQDLLGLDLFGTHSSASTPTGGNYGFPSPQQGGATGGASTSAANSAASTPVSSANTPDMFAASGSDTPPSLQGKQRSASSSTPTGGPLFPGMPATRISSRSKIPLQSLPRPSGRQSPALSSSMNRADSTSSITSANVTFNTTSMPIGSSRGPSPLTIGMSDTIPLAVAFTETVNAYFKGLDESLCKVRLTGDMMISFPAGIVHALMDNPSPAMLSFRVKNASRLENIHLNKQLIIQDTAQSTADVLVYTFEMATLSEHLKRQADTNKTASYFNIDILKYQVRPQPGIESTPLHLVTYWKCEPDQTDFRLDYKYSCSAMATPLPLTNVSVHVPVQGEVTNMQSMPSGTWSAETKRATWKLNDISDMNEDNAGGGTVRAKFDISSGPGSPSPVAVQFTCEGTTLSGLDFELLGNGYRLSLQKKRFGSGKYLSETDTEIQYV